jgi:hypothetical protein
MAEGYGAYYDDRQPYTTPFVAVSRTADADHVPSVLVSNHLSDTEPQAPSLYHIPSNARARESRKLLSHVLERLQNRELPPPAYTDIAPAHDDLIQNFILDRRRVATRNRSDNKVLVTAALPDDEDDQADDGSFSTDSTYELMLQLRDVLRIFSLQGWSLSEE